MWTRIVTGELTSLRLVEAPHGHDFFHFSTVPHRSLIVRFVYRISKLTPYGYSRLIHIAEEVWRLEERVMVHSERQYLKLV